MSVLPGSGRSCSSTIAQSAGSCRIWRIFSLRRDLISPGGQMWQKVHSKPLPQPFGCQNQAHGLQPPEPCSIEPSEGGSTGCAGGSDGNASWSDSSPSLKAVSPGGGRNRATSGQGVDVAVDTADSSSAILYLAHCFFLRALISLHGHTWQ